jgi:hypothetical protein
MKPLVVPLALACALALVSPARAHASTNPAQLVLLVTPLVVQAVLDLQEAWSCYLEGFRRRHPSPRPNVPRPDSIPATPAPVAPEVAPPLAPPPASPESISSAPAEH